MASLTDILKQVGFDPNLIPTFLGIAQAESGGNPAAIHNNARPDLPKYNSYVAPGAGREFSVGLFQINLGGTSSGRIDSSENLTTTNPILHGKPWQILLDPTANAVYAKDLAAGGRGLGAWSTFHPGITGGDIQVNSPNDPGNSFLSGLTGIPGIGQAFSPSNLGTLTIPNPLADVPSAITAFGQSLQKDLLSFTFGILGLGLIIMGFYLIAAPAINSTAKKAATVGATVAK